MSTQRESVVFAESPRCFVNRWIAYHINEVVESETWIWCNIDAELTNDNEDYLGMQNLWTAVVKTSHWNGSRSEWYCDDKRKHINHVFATKHGKITIGS
jgi:hypothetical protein